MTWFKVDDKLHDHRKARAAQKAAMGVWVLAGSWAADNLTNGFIPASVLPRWGTRGDARRLVDVGLWVADEQDGEPGWRFHSWPDFQPTRAAKLAEREAKAEAGRKGGRASGASRREAATKQDASALVEPPSRPVPSRPESVVQVVSQSGWLTRALEGLTDDDITRITTRLRCSPDHARAVVRDVLTRSSTPVAKPVAYVLGAIDKQPERYRPAPGRLRREDECLAHPGKPAAHCGGCAADRLAGDA